jgi:hypothetical protein
MSRSPTRLLVRDELIGFARSKVMLVLWIILPCIALAGFLLLRNRMFGGAGAQMTATTFMSLIESSVAGTVAALMIAVDIISERNRNVYTLLVIRPIPREAIIWAKFLGAVLDAVRGTPPTAATLYDTGQAIVRMTAVNAMATATGALFGVLVRSILVAVILVLYVGQNVAVIPMLPTYLGLFPATFWWFMVLSFALVAIVLWFAGRACRRAPL